MPNDSDHIDIDPLVSVELNRWDRVASDVRTVWQERIAKIKQLNDSSTWGADTPGLAFQASYYQGGTLFQVITNGGQIIADVAAEPTRIREAITNSLGTDQAQGQVMDKLQT